LLAGRVFSGDEIGAVSAYGYDVGSGHVLSSCEI
jgi:hypothetical protein